MSVIRDIGTCSSGMLRRAAGGTAGASIAADLRETMHR
jgi:hypothetical protein